jgi:hypothetical protein
MDAKGILLGRLDTLDTDLAEAKSRLENEKIPAHLADRRGHELIDGIDDLRGEIAEAVASAQLLPDADTPLDATNPAAALGVQVRMKAAWTAFDGLEVDTGRLLTEVLALIQGARSRADPTSLASIADRLLDEFSANLDDFEWKRFTFESEGEGFTGSTRFIRLRFPMKDIWNLPVAAHEFGHFLASVIKVPAEAESLVKALGTGNEVDRDKNWYYLNEFFADAVAVYATGPAYGYTSLLVRFNPVRAWSETDSIHPQDGERAELILRMLDRMGAEPDGGELGLPAQTLRGFWTAALAAAGQPLTMTPERTQAIDNLVHESYDLILKPKARRLRYNSWKEARKLQSLFTNGPTPVEKPPALTNLLNAAWRQRLKIGANAADVNRRFLVICQKPAASSGGGV